VSRRPLWHSLPTLAFNDRDSPDLGFVALRYIDVAGPPPATRSELHRATTNNWTSNSSLLSGFLWFEFSHPPTRPTAAGQM
jgi:hypothetical protein